MKLSLCFQLYFQILYTDFGKYKFELKECIYNLKAKKINYIFEKFLVNKINFFHENFQMQNLKSVLHFILYSRSSLE